MRLFVYGFISLVAWCGSAHAHFLWLVAHPEGKAGEVRAYFSETASPDDPKLLEKFPDLKAVSLSRSRDGVKKQEIELKRADDALAGELPAEVSTPITAQQSYGVITRGGEAFLLKYYAKTYPTALPGQWTAVNDAQLASFEITPELSGADVVFRVTWQGKPAAGDQVTIEGPGIKDKLQGDTNEEGQFRCQLPANGLFSIRARHTEKISGKLGDESYASIRHFATLALPYSVPTLSAMTPSLPDLPKGITSFGAALVEQDIYIYGGHFGSAHHYSSSGQSNEFLRLSLKTPGAAWEKLPPGPKLTGLAMVSHQGNLYRVGGFTVKNGDDQPQDLWSQNEFAAYDPATISWTDLPALPEPRSSHDACVLDGKLYVVGGWNMAGPDNTVWHDTAWVCDLDQTELKWTAIAAPPFHRRALSLAAYQGKIYVSGGMQESGKPTKRVDIYDPASNAWSLGPELIGAEMEGFGSSAFAVDGRLIVSTMSGSLQQLREDGTKWDLAGQLQHPRFFHRQLATPVGELLFIAGASMQTGKTKTVEMWQSVAK